MNFIYLSILFLFILNSYAGLQKPKHNEVPAPVTMKWHYYDRFSDHETCVKECPKHLIDERRDYDGTPESYMCMYSVSKVWYAMGVSKAFNCYYKNNIVKAYNGMAYEENNKYYGYEDGAFYDQKLCQDRCKGTCWNEEKTNYFYCIWTTDRNYN